MRKMKNIHTGRILTVSEFFMTKNMWEYYVIETEDGPKNTDEKKFCLVLGYENELGDVSMNEVAPHKMLHTKNLQEVAPAIDYVWID